MNVIDAIENRRSVKHFVPNHTMPKDDIAQLIRLTRLSPSSFNMQNYRFVIMRDDELRRQIRAVAWDQAQVIDASLQVVLSSHCGLRPEHGTKDPFSLLPHEVKSAAHESHRIRLHRLPSH